MVVVILDSIFKRVSFLDILVLRGSDDRVSISRKKKVSIRTTADKVNNIMARISRQKDVHTRAEVFILIQEASGLDTI